MKIKDVSSFIINTARNKMINGSRFFLVNYFPKFLNSYLLVEYPKSGATWLGQLISSYLNIPFPRNRFPVLRESMIHGHYLPKKNFKEFKKIFYMVRDGRDVMVSAYYYYLVLLESMDKNNKDTSYFKRNLNFENIEDIKNNLPKFIKFMFTHRPSRFIRFSYEGNWSDFNEEWYNYYKKNKSKVIMVRYEDLLKDTEKELIRILNLLDVFEIKNERVEKIVEEYSFRRQSGRKQGEENTKSFLRKGIAGDWKNKFTKESAGIFDYYAGDMLIELGYEKDRGWVKRKFN